MMRRGTICLAAIMLLAVPAEPVFCDDTQDQLAAAREAGLEDPTQTSKARDQAPEVTLEATEDGTFIVATVGVGGKKSPWTLNLQLRGPLDRSGETSLADLDGPLGDTVATLQLTYEWDSRIDGTSLTPVCQAYNAKLREKAAKARPKPQPIPAVDCNYSTLNARGETWALRAAQARNIDIPDALCVDYNEGLATGRLLPAGIADVKNKSGTPEYPMGYNNLCNLARVEPLWKKKEALKLRNAARQKVCDENNKKVGTVEGVKWIAAGACDDAKASEVASGWEAAARKFACPRTELPATCSWDDLAAAAWTTRKATLEKEQYGEICSDFNSFDTGELIDSRVGECSYRSLAALGPEWEMRALRTMPAQPWFLTITASGAEPDFAFVDPETLEPAASSEDNKSVSVQLATMRRGTWWSLGYTNRTTYRAGPTRELCSSVGDGDDLLCSDVRFGAPNEREQEIIQLDVKRLFNPSLGAIGRVLYDFEEDLWNPHLILYFLEDKSKDKKKAGLRGGLDLAYNEDDNFTARLFVGTKFDINKP